MADGMDLERLRELVWTAIAGLSDMHTHARLGEACMQLGLPRPPDEGSKRERVAGSFDALPDTDLPTVAERVLTGEQIFGERSDPQCDPRCPLGWHLLFIKI